MDIDIDEINKVEKRNKVNTIKCTPIYEVIDEAYFIVSKIFSDAFCNNAEITRTMLNLSHLRQKKRMAM